MNNLNILSKNHFAAYEQVIADYKLLLRFENELKTNTGPNNNPSSTRIKNEIITILERIIANKNLLIENTKADEEYLRTLTNDV